ncbi:putative transcriptional repressor NanR [Escherichia coli 99.0741]|nr:putative transcriptional repressor NanR [Escherichia coli 99.0741]
MQTRSKKNKLNQAANICWKYVDDNINFIRADINFHRVLSEIPENPVFVAIHTALTDWLINTHSEEHSNITRRVGSLAAAACHGLKLPL